MLLSRSPKEPIETERTLSPGLRVFTMATSSPPVPEVVKESTSEEVPKTQFRPSVTRRKIWANSGPRWFIIWPAPAIRTSSGHGVGPGIRRFTGSSEGWVLVIVNGCSSVVNHARSQIHAEHSIAALRLVDTGRYTAYE